MKRKSVNLKQLVLFLFILIFGLSSFPNEKSEDNSVSECFRNFRTFPLNKENIDLLNLPLNKAKNDESPCLLFDNHGYKETAPMQSHDYKNHKLSIFSSQELSGTNLAKEEMATIEWAETVPTVLFDGMFNKKYLNLNTSNSVLLPKIDADYGSHGTMTATAINGRGPFGATNHTDYIAVRVDEKNSDYLETYNALKKAGKVPRIGVQTGDWIEEEDFYRPVSMPKGIKKFLDDDTVWFSAANADREGVKAKASIIRVGNIHYTGLPYSAHPRETDIYAYAGGFTQASIGNSGGFEWFGGTSAATPLTAGAVTNALALIPDLTTSEIRNLLKLTALPSVESALKEGRPGILNGYLLYKVAKKIATKCKYNAKVNLQERVKCKQEALNDPNLLKNLDSTDIKLLSDEIHSTFPSCSKKRKKSKQENNKKSCENKKYIFKKLQKLAFLNPKSKTIWGVLACITAYNGFTGNAEFFSLIHGLNNNPEQYIKEMIDRALKEYNSENNNTIDLQGLSHFLKQVPNHPVAQYFVKKLVNTAIHEDIYLGIIQAMDFDSSKRYFDKFSDSENFKLFTEAMNFIAQNNDDSLPNNKKIHSLLKENDLEKLKDIVTIQRILGQKGPEVCLMGHVPSSSKS